MGLVYKLDFASGKSYIGLTTRTLDARLKQHRTDSRNAKRAFIVHAAWVKYGEPVVTVLAEADGEDLKRAEREAIAKFGTLSPNGYNLTAGGDKPSWSDESRQKSSASLKGRQFTDEHRARIAQALIGRKKSAAHIKRMRESAALRTDRHDLTHFWVGKKQSPEHIAKRIAARMANAAASHLS